VWVLPSEPASVPLVRERLRELRSEMAADHLDDALLATSEVVTNAVLHGDGSVTVRVWVDGTVVRVEVADGGSAVPRPSADLGGDQAEDGRGLFIVDAVTTRWGVTPEHPGPGKTVWFELGQGDHRD
jgi:anti-sigma regulatory factor (Ser/Thr protein kinase)